MGNLRVTQKDFSRKKSADNARTEENFTRGGTGYT
jgi:hypothetical protein